ncbi:MAG: hypothetical protein EAZ28_25495 [Oscillatoriales cyanobacterium]|nr:MAG: hypothetical protein EAZ28_25495 [Oscillatoriales cyanobacterium]
MTLAAIVACQIGNVFACRSERTSIFRLGFFSNPLIWLGIAVECVLILSIIYFPPLQKVFATAPLSTWQWSLLIVCPPLILIADEIRKKIVYSSAKKIEVLVKKPGEFLVEQASCLLLTIRNRQDACFTKE